MFEQLINDVAARFNLGRTAIAGLVRGLLQLLTNERTGGTGGFLDMFRKAGLGDTLTSWFGGKEGQAITGMQIESALGVAEVDRLATAAGLNRSTTSAVLATLIPKLISRLTPNGVLPSTGSLLSQVSGYLALPAAGAATLRDYATSTPKRWPSWLPWAALAAIALIAWIWLRAPAGTLNPQLTVTNSDGKIMYSGQVRDETTRRAIADALTATFGAANISGEVRVDRNVKKIAWTARPKEIFGALKRPGVEFRIEGDTVALGGWLSAADRQALVERLRSFFGAQAVFSTLTDRAAEAVRTANTRATSALSALSTGTSNITADALVQTLNLAIINFATGSSTIPPDQMDLIKQSADAVKRAPTGTKIEIGGHTDNTGDAAGNQRLSEARAEAVRDVFVAAGVDPATLTTAGYGDTRPRNNNDSEYGRFQNRRIEYTLVR
jgi:OmpA-OmpF porin, OOP family